MGVGLFVVGRAGHVECAVEPSAIQGGDLRIVAESTAGGATHLITRDEALLRSAGAIERLTGVAVLRPADFLLAVQAGAAAAFEPELIKTSGLRHAAICQLARR